MEFRRVARASAMIAFALGLLLVPLARPALAEDVAEKDAPKRVPVLWEVQTEPTIYLFGTIHVADERVTTHPPVVAQALERSQALYTELDFMKLDRAALAKHIMLPDGKQLAAIASAELVARLDAIIKRYELPQMQAMQFKVIRPWLTAVQLPIAVNAKRKAAEEAAAKAAAGDDAAGDAAPASQDPMANLALDLRLYMGAQQAGKVVGGLEKPEEQFSIFNEITLEKQVEMLAESIAAIEKLDAPEAEGGKGEKSGKTQVDQIEMLIRMYLAGDVEAFYKLMTESMGDDEDMKAFMEKLLDRRNIVMVRRMLEAAEKHPDKPMFVAVGAGHYAGPKGIVKLLRETGFRVRRLGSVKDLDAPWPKMGAEASAASPSSRARPAHIRIGPFCIPCPRSCR